MVCFPSDNSRTRSLLLPSSALMSRLPEGNVALRQRLYVANHSFNVRKDLFFCLERRTKLVQKYCLSVISDQFEFRTIVGNDAVRHEVIL